MSDRPFKVVVDGTAKSFGSLDAAMEAAEAAAVAGGIAHVTADKTVPLGVAGESDVMTMSSAPVDRVDRWVIAESRAGEVNVDGLAWARVVSDAGPAAES